jgi:hypothetical protein
MYGAPNAKLPAAFPLHHTMTLKPAVAAVITSQKLVEIELSNHKATCRDQPRYDGTAKLIALCRVSAAKATRLGATTIMRIKPVGAFDEGFARGWSNLPVELKVEILFHNLTHTGVIKHETRWNGSSSIHDIILATSLRHHIALGPEFADLARQVFYEKNKFDLPQVYSHTTYRHKILLPPQDVRPYIRTLTIDGANQVWSYWRVLEKLAAETLAFEHLQYVSVTFELWSTRSCYFSPPLGFHNLVPDSNLKFPCKGEIKFAAMKSAVRPDGTSYNG